MTKTLFFLLLSVITTNTFSQNVIIPDANFKAYLLANTSINTNSDTQIQISEATAFSGHIICPNLNIADLTGIEAFINLTQLTCYNNQLTSLDLSNNTSLILVRVEVNQLTSIILNRTNSVLEYLNCTLNQLTNFNPAEHPLLEILLIRFNQLTNINVTQNPLLWYLGCGSNTLTTLDISQNPLLKVLHCDNNQFTTLDLSQNSVLENISCTNNQLIGLDFYQNPVLSLVTCWQNQITNINVAQNPALTKLLCSNNLLTSLDVTQNTNLTELQCDNNPITSLDVTQNTNLTELGCYSSQLTSLNVQNGNNVNFTYYNSNYNPNLICILVDDATYSTPNWSGVDPASTFVNNFTVCNALSIDNYYLTNSFNVFPNPSSSYINISYNKPIDKIVIYNILGEKVIATTATTIATNFLTNGVYFIKLYAQNKLGVKRFIKQ